VLFSFSTCPDPNENGEGIVATLAVPFGTVLDEPGEEIRFVWTNQDCPSVLATGTLVIEKWEDLDGNGDRNGGEAPLSGWTMTVTGPQFPGGQQFVTDGNGQVILPGIFAGA
jgi:hypothetical protein